MEKHSVFDSEDVLLNLKSSIEKGDLISSFLNYYFRNPSCSILKEFINAKLSDEQECDLFTYLASCIQTDENRHSVINFVIKYLGKHSIRFNPHKRFVEVIIEDLFNSLDAHYISFSLAYLCAVLTFHPNKVQIYNLKFCRIFSRFFEWNWNLPAEISKDDLYFILASLSSFFFRVYALFPLALKDSLCLLYKQSQSDFKTYVIPLLDHVKCHPNFIVPDLKIQDTESENLDCISSQILSYSLDPNESFQDLFSNALYSNKVKEINIEGFDKDLNLQLPINPKILSHSSGSASFIPSESDTLISCHHSSSKMPPNVISSRPTSLSYEDDLVFPNISDECDVFESSAFNSSHVQDLCKTKTYSEMLDEHLEQIKENLSDEQVSRQYDLACVQIFLERFRKKFYLQRSRSLVKYASESADNQHKLINLSERIESLERENNYLRQELNTVSNESHTGEQFAEYKKQIDILSRQNLELRASSVKSINKLDNDFVIMSGEINFAKQQVESCHHLKSEVSKLNHRVLQLTEIQTNLTDQLFLERQKLGVYKENELHYASNKAENEANKSLITNLQNDLSSLKAEHEEMQETHRKISDERHARILQLEQELALQKEQCQATEDKYCEVQNILLRLEMKLFERFSSSDLDEDYESHSFKLDFKR